MNETASSPKRTLLKEGLVIWVIALAFSWTIGESNVGKHLARWTLDLFIKWDTQTDEDQIVLIDITQEDYEKIFDRKRPLNPKIIVDLINAAKTAGAKVVAVDINTADWPSEDANMQIPRLPPGAAIVWARNFHPDWQSRKTERILEPLLGGVATSDQECYGVPALEREAGIVRYFYSGFSVGGKREPSFIDQIVYRSKNPACLQSEDRDEELRIISFSSRIRTESASTLLEQAKQKDWGSRPGYANKILIIGGSFPSGSDMFPTPVGAKSGLEITGQALSSAIRDKARRELGKGCSVLIDGTVGMLLLLVGLKGRRPQIVATVIFAPLLALVSLYFFRQYYLFLSFVPFLAGIFAHVYLGRLHGHMQPLEKSSLYDRLGGVYSIATVVDDFIDRIMVDPRLNANPLVDEAHHRVPPAGFKYLVTEMVCWATGGPQKYTGKSMVDSHSHLKITAAEWEAFLDDFQQTLDKFAVPAKEQAELKAIVNSTRSDIVVSGEAAGCATSRF